MSAIFGRTTVYRALKRQDGRVVCVDPDYLAQTSKVVDNQRDFDLLLSLGWTTHPQTAMARFEEREQQISNDAAARAYDDRHVSEAAQAEVAQVESSTIQHLPEIPEAPRKRGRPRKIVQ